MSFNKKPPVVTIMGHVDHGKTSLLDYIRKSRLVAAEYGEITQAIGAYQIEYRGQKITFIDTPGHEAFLKMRQMGVMAADIVVLVIAANDGVMQQTKESIKIIKEANVPFIVAVNKMDLPEASVDKIKLQLAENEVFIEGYGGNIAAVPISAKTGQGIDQLLEMIVLTAEVGEFKADPRSPLEALVIESRFDKNRGSTATLIIKNGTLKRGDEFWIGSVCSKIMMMKDDKGGLIEEALPGDPVLVMGFSKLPAVGARITSCQAPKMKPETGLEEKTAVGNKPKLKIILKTDVYGSMEAILSCLPDDVLLMEKQVGEIKDSDVLLAKTIGADIYSFNLNLSSSIEKLAAAEKVRIKTFKIIYDLLADIEKRVLKLIEPEIDRKILGKAEILQVFEMKGQKIAGGKVIEGKVNKGFPVMLKRGENKLADTRILSLKEQKQDINEAVLGGEFGAVFGGKVDFQPGDVVISYSLEEN